ncbi:AI-2E family transporter [Ramlibacter humi]|uniref:AI-2E family transporter n=1 Tax=Ramlibacter humi TaxID=2530451 RepID=UPI001430D580|nr:AI-2E family transporter [Ramlibacter humi]
MALAAVCAALLLVLWLHLLPALLAGAAAYAVYGRIRAVVDMPRSPHLSAAATVGLTLLVAVVAIAGAVEAVHAVWTPRGGLAGLMQFLADAIDGLRAALPPSMAQHLPESAADLQDMLSQWLRANSHRVQRWSRYALEFAAQVFVGTAVGLLFAVQRPLEQALPDAAGVVQTLRRFVHAFADVVAAQLRIALANTVLTAIYLLGVLPVAGVHLPASRTLVVLTLFMGMVPLVGNLISNAAILLVALTVSPGVAIAALVYLVAIHKLEYLLNAHFIGRRTQVPAGILLSSMLVLQAAFGPAGLLAAPIYTAWLFGELAGPRDDGPA